MSRFNRRFEVKREMNDGGKIRPDDSYKQNGGNSSLEQQQETEREANQVGGFDDFEQDYDNAIEEEFDAHKYFVERAGKIDFTDMEENQFMEKYANTIISSFPNISRDDASALLLYVTRNEANRQGILENIRVRMDDKTKVGATRFVGIDEKGPISEIVFSEKELIDGVNNGNMEAYVTGIGHLVEAACHEVEHAKQNSQIYSKKPQLNYETLRMAKESINVRVNPEFYRKNYRSYIMERNAFLNGRLQAKKALENLKGVFSEELYSKIEKRIDELIASDKSADTTIMKTEESEYKNSDSADMVLTELTDSIMPMYAIDALEQYPILSYQYREDGTKKDLSELLLERNTKIQQLHDELLTAIPSRRTEIAREIEGITAFYDEMVKGDRQLLAQKEEMDKQQKEERNNGNTIYSTDIEDTEVQNEESKNQNMSEPHENCQYKYTEAIEKIEKNSDWLYEYYIEKNGIEWSIEERENFIGKTMGEEYSKLFEDSAKKQLAEIFGKLDFDTLNTTRMNYDDRFLDVTHQKYLLGLQKIENKNGSVFVAQYEESMEDGQPFDMVYEYYTLDEMGNLVLMEDEPKFEQGKNIVVEITQSEIADNLDKRKDIIGDMDKRLAEEVSVYQQKVQEVANKTEQPMQSSFEQILINNGFDANCVQGIKTTIKSVNPRNLVAMDNILSKTKEQTLARGGIEENGNEQDYR